MAEKSILGLIHLGIVRTTALLLDDLAALFKTQEGFRYKVVACLVLIFVAFWLVAQWL
jgi:diacylglycerol kinase